MGSGALWATLIAAASGCAPRITGYVPISSHTMHISADAETDAVWLNRVEYSGSEKVVDKLLRCYNTAEGPVCLEARTAK